MGDNAPPPQKRLKQAKLTALLQKSSPPNFPLSTTPVTILQSSSALSPSPPSPIISPYSQNLVLTGPPRTVNINDYPAVWSKKQWEKWVAKYNFLLCRLGKLGCRTCADAKSIVGPARGVHLSEQWIDIQIGSKTAKKLKDKIYQHAASDAHKAAEKILSQRSQEILPTSFVDRQTQLFQETIRIFRTAYLIAKSDLSYKAHEQITLLQELNGIDIGTIHRSDHSCANILKLIASSMRKSLCKRISNDIRFVSLMLDEATLFTSSVIIIYLRASLLYTGDSIDLGVENIFLSLVEAKEESTASGIISSVEKELTECEITPEYLQTALVGICTDGAAVMTGENNGVSMHFVQKYGADRIERFHCVAHKLELAVGDSLKSVTSTNHFQIFIQSLSNLYNQSPKNQRELSQAASDTEIQLLHVNGIFTVRWVASSFKCVRAIWRDFPALHQHMCRAAIDPTRSSTEKAKFAGLCKKLSSISFVHDLAIMKDVLRELSSASLELQQEKISVSQCLGCIHSTSKVLEAMKREDGAKSVEKAKKALEQKMFKGVQLHEGHYTMINKQQFLQSVIDSIRRRFPEHGDSLLKSLQILQPDSWPVSDERVLFGDSEVLRMAKKLGLNGRKVVEQFREFKETNGKNPKPELRLLLAAVETYPASSAECERGFSSMNNIATKKRNSFQTTNISDLMFIKLNGPSLASFDPASFVDKWLRAGHRQSTSWKPGKSASSDTKRRRIIHSMTIPCVSD